MGKPVTPVAERIVRRVTVTEEVGIVIDGQFIPCWTWTGATSRDGYGQIKVDGKCQSTHRVSFSTLVGPIGDGLVLDHLCKNRACCCPYHLDPVTQEENVRRGDSPVARFMQAK